MRKAGDQAEQRYWRTPLDDGDLKRTRGDVHIVTERCKGCAYCVEYCPLEVLRMSEQFNLKGYHPPEVGKADTCVACRLCEVICPEFSIYIHERTADGSGETVAGGEEVLT